MEFVWKESDDTRLAGAAQALEASWMVSARWCNGIGENGLRESGLPWLRRKATKEVFTINKALVFAN